MIEKADVAIIGGGIMGAATAFYLAKNGKSSVVLLEKGTFGSGSTGGSAAIVRHYYSTEIMMISAIESRKTFENFRKLVGEPLEYVNNSWIALDSGEPAKTAGNRVAEMRKHGVNAEALSAQEVRDRYAFIHVWDDEVGSLDRDAGFVSNPKDATAIYARQAKKLGAHMHENVKITGIRTNGNSVTSVQTSKGNIAVGCVLNAAGPWASEVGHMVGLDLPVEAVRQQLIDLKPPGGWPIDRPTISDRRELTYIKPSKGGLAHCGWHPYTKAVDPDNFSRKVDQDYVEKLVPMIVARCPSLKGAKLADGFSALYENTPDRYPLVGESEEVRGFIICAGWSGHGFKHGPFFGRLMVELIEKGSTSVDISILSPERFKKGKAIETPYTKSGAAYG